MNIGIMPIIGVTLPFVSYGGTSMLMVWVMTGLIFSIAMRKPVPPYRPSFEYDE
jgi:rod shape determining protein RodA